MKIRITSLAVLMLLPALSSFQKADRKGKERLKIEKIVVYYDKEVTYRCVNLGCSINEIFCQGLVKEGELLTHTITDPKKTARIELLINQGQPDEYFEFDGPCNAFIYYNSGSVSTMCVGYLPVANLDGVVIKFKDHTLEKSLMADAH